MDRPDRQRSLQDALRARRAERKLISPGELARREAARRQQEAETAAAAVVTAWRAGGKAPDAGKRLEQEVYAALFALDQAAYEATREWGRLERAQLARVPACEVARCGSTEGVRAVQRRAAGAGELLTLCAGCAPRLRRLARELRRPPTDSEARGLDPAAPLYDRPAVDALRDRYDLRL